MQQKRLLIIFGGMSEEHEVSISSAHSILNAVDRTRFYPATIGITRQGQFIKDVNPSALIANRASITSSSPKWLKDDHYWTAENWLAMIAASEVIFPVLHGPAGEDGTIQGMFEILDKKYVGSSVTSSAICMDKSVSKDILVHAGLPSVPYFYFNREEYRVNPSEVERRAEEFGYPLFVKPSCMGSSVGISKVKDKQDLRQAIMEALRHGSRVIIEKGIIGREVECSVIGNEFPRASEPGEIVANAEFYDYDSKYINDNADLMIPADLPAATVEEIQRLSIQSFKLLQCSCLARVDFFIEQSSNRVIINEVNTMPGFTPISMYPKLLIHQGLTYQNLITELIELALKK